MPQQFSIAPGLLRPNPWNANSVSPENEEKLAHSLKELGFFKPIVVRETDEGYEILGGEHRWDLAKRESLAEVPVFSVGRVSDDVAKKIMLADNAGYGTSDPLKLAEVIADLEDLDSLLPWTETDLKAIMSSTDIALEELELPESFDEDAKTSEPAASKAPKTHTIMRFKVPLGDAEKLTEIITKTQKRHGYSSGDDLTNAGDALVHIVLGEAAE